jgi:glycyl-tRNA synthetase beta chain
MMRILIEKKLHFSVSSGVEKAIRLLSGQFDMKGVASGGHDAKVTDLDRGIASFLSQRLAFILSEMGMEQDVVDSVLSADSDDPFRSWLKADALARWKSNEQFSGVVISFKRVSNILKTQEYPTPVAADLREDVERRLYEHVIEVSGLISEAVSDENYENAIAHLLVLKATIDAFFEGVMVMDKDAEVRGRRLGLLAFVRSEFLKLADFSRLSEPTQAR